MLIPDSIQNVRTSCKSSGPKDADIFVLGESPGAEDAKSGIPFVGNSGQLLTSMFANIGLDQNEVYMTHVAKSEARYGKPSSFFVNYTKMIPNKYMQECVNVVKEEIEHVRPKVIIALGSTALWALTGHSSIVKWRGSQLEYTFSDGTTCWLIPTYHPSAVLRMWIWRAITLRDLRKALTYETWERPNYEFYLRPTFTSAMEYLDGLEERARTQTLLVSGDLETRAGHIACLGIGTSRTEAICIPFMDINKPDGSYWNELEEVSLVQKLVKLFKLTRNDGSPGLVWVYQNGAFDYQYFARHWGAIPYLATDTMLEHHVAWAGDLPKGLDFLSGMYCSFHEYWKEDGKFWDPRYTPEEQLWEYNCKDAVVTWEVAEVLASQTAALGLEEQVHFQTQEQFPAVLDMMLRGVRCDVPRKEGLSDELDLAFKRMQQRLWHMTDSTLNVKSPKQMQEFFYVQMGQPIIRARKANAKGQKNPTCNEEALEKIGKRASWLKPICDLITTMRSVGVFKSTFIDMKLDDDNRIRCSYGIAGTETFRYNSSKNAFNSGGNLQNIPGGDEGAEGDAYLPNVKNIFIPDEGYIIAEHDLAQADAQVVAWEANDDKLKYIFRNGIDLHLANASDMYGLGIRLQDISDPDGIEYHSKKFKRQRQSAKAGCHATNYVTSAYTLGITLGITTRDAQAFIDKWFSEHPGIKKWQDDINLQLQETREVRNKFGFRRYYFDRIEGILPEAVAWIPQSTVALIVDKGLVNIHKNIPEVQPLLQVHDSLIVQYPRERFIELLPKVHEQLLIPVPYDDPLTIPVGIEVSGERWGAKKEITWDFKGEVTW